MKSRTLAAILLSFVALGVFVGPQNAGRVGGWFIGLALVFFALKKFYSVV